MKQRFANNRGITLIALVITIIVLLILAGISISMLSGDNGLLNRAVQAKDATRGGEVQETVTLAAANNAGVEHIGGTKQTKTDVITQLHNDGKLTDSEVATLEENDIIVIGGITIDFSVLGGSNWEYNHTTQTVKKGSLELKIGDYVNTTPYTVDGKQFDGKWRVLGEENGQLLLVSANYVDFEGSTDSSGNPLIRLQGSNGIDNEIARLNTLSAKFADGTKTEKGRSIKVEDINKITGYDPTDSRINPNDLTQKGLFGNGYIYQYGNNVTYTIKAGVQNSGKNVVWYKGDQAVTAETESSYTKFIPYGESSDITSPFTIKSTYYSYFPETLGSFPGSAVASGQTMEGISTSSPAYDMLFKPQSNIPYWLASPCVDADTGNASWHLFIVAPPGLVAGGYLWFSGYGSSSSTYGVRPAVSLKSNITPTLKSTDSSTGISTYEI